MILSPAWEHYRLFVCADCHPDCIDRDTPADMWFEMPYEVALPVDDHLVKPEQRLCPLGACPRCGSPLSLCGEDTVVITRA